MLKLQKSVRKVALPDHMILLLLRPCSGVGVVPKKNGTWRMIMHLSAPLGSNVNDGIDPESYSLVYSTLDEAIRLIVEVDGSALMVKVVLKSAFCIIPVQKDDWNLLGIHWRRKFYIDKRLPFCLRSSPWLFNQLAEALQWILTNNYHLLTYYTTSMISCW